MAIQNDNMEQSTILPRDISELIQIDHICYRVIAIVNSINPPHQPLAKKQLHRPPINHNGTPYRCYTKRQSIMDPYLEY